MRVLDTAVIPREHAGMRTRTCITLTPELSTRLEAERRSAAWPAPLSWMIESLLRRALGMPAWIPRYDRAHGDVGTDDGDRG